MSRELQVAIAAAQAGAAELAAARGVDLRIDYKDARANLVTVADRRSQQAITDVILDAFPTGHAIDGEEGTAGDRGAGHVWYVDPLDGTTNYAHGLPFFCVSIALRSFGETTAGVVYDPVHDELFAADKIAGATLNGRALRVSPVTQLDRALIVAQAQAGAPGSACRARTASPRNSTSAPSTATGATARTPSSPPSAPTSRNWSRPAATASRSKNR
jgi:myo-inositol-1(or 4)-monophosphatase